VANLRKVCANYDDEWQLSYSERLRSSQIKDKPYQILLRRVT
jgi:hypothetical protein